MHPPLNKTKVNIFLLLLYLCPGNPPQSEVGMVYLFLMFGVIQEASRTLLSGLPASQGNRYIRLFWNSSLLPSSLNFYSGENYVLIACMTATGVTLGEFLQFVKLYHPGEYLTNTCGTKNSMRSDWFEYSNIVALILTFFIGKVGAKLFTKHPLALFNNTRPKKKHYRLIWVFGNHIPFLRSVEMVISRTLSCV